jgi:hypothetical protein
MSWGKGRDTGTCLPMIDHAGRQHHLISLSTNGRASVPFGWILTQPPFDDEAMRMEFVQRLNQIQGMNIPADSIAKYPNFPLEALADGAASQHFLDTLDWFVREVIASGA